MSILAVEQHGAEYFLLAYVVMDDAIYVLFKPNVTIPRKVTQNWRSVTARRLSVECEREGAIWDVDTQERSVIGQFAIVSAADDVDETLPPQMAQSRHISLGRMP